MNDKNSLFRYSLNYGVALGVTLSVFELLAYFTGLIGKPIMSTINFAVILSMLIISVKKYRDQFQSGFITFGNAFLIGLFIFLVSGVIFGIYRWVEYSMAPEIIENMKLEVEDQLLDSNMPDDQVELISALFEMTLKPATQAFGTIFGFAFWGSILSLIIAAIFKRNPNPFQSDLNS